MEGRCSTGQSPQWAVVLMAEEDLGDFLISHTVGQTSPGLLGTAWFREGMPEVLRYAN